MHNILKPGQQIYMGLSVDQLCKYDIISLTPFNSFLSARP